MTGLYWKDADGTFRELAPGHWLIICQDGHTSLRERVSPAPGFDVALELFSRELATELQQAVALQRPADIRSGPVAKRLMIQLTYLMNRQDLVWRRRAASDAVETALRKWRARLIRRNPELFSVPGPRPRRRVLVS